MSGSNDRAAELNELMQDAFGFHLREEYWQEPVTNDTLRDACQQLLKAIAVGLSAVANQEPEAGE